ncbi:MAG: ABC transporter ATP-binding protein [Actinomycetes bacterium]
MSNSRLTVRELNGFYGTRQVLHNVSLNVKQHECLAIVGESGAGKTTLAQCLVGLNKSWNGEVLLDEAILAADMHARELNQLRRIQYIFQNPYLSLNPRKTIREIVAEPLRHFFGSKGSDSDQEVLRVLEDVSLGASYLDRYPDQLSGGERQRVAIARALIVKPEILVCDEITSALDVSVQAVIVELLRRLQAEHNLSLIFITHNLALVRSIAQRCIVLSNGIVVESGPVSDILERPTHPYTVGLIADMPALPEPAVRPATVFEVP